MQVGQAKRCLLASSCAQESILSKCRTIKNMRNLYLLYDMTYDDDNFRENRRLPTMHVSMCRSEDEVSYFFGMISSLH